MEKYGNAAAQGELSKKLLLGQTEKYVEYDRDCRIINDLALFDMLCSLYFISIRPAVFPYLCLSAG